MPTFAIVVAATLRIDIQYQSGEEPDPRIAERQQTPQLLCRHMAQEPQPDRHKLRVPGSGAHTATDALQHHLACR